MSNGEEVRKVSVRDIQLVQNLIERCLQLYMSQSEVVSTLLTNAKIEPGFTELVWQKLEAENEEFFKAYHLRLIVKDQITRFNQLLERQAELMREMCSTDVSPIPLSNGPQIQSMHENSTYGAPQPVEPSVNPENVQHAFATIPNVHTSSVFSVQPSMVQVGVNMVDYGGMIDVPTNGPFAQGPNMGMVQGMNNGMISSYTGNNSPFMFGQDNNLLEPRSVIGQGSIPHPFNGGGPGSQALNETMQPPEMNTFGIFGQMPQNFSLSDLTADFANSTDILESYSGSPFLGTNGNFPGPHFQGQQQGVDVGRLDTIFQGPTYDNFGQD